MPAGAPAGEGRGGKALVALALAALFLAAGIAVAASTGGENTGSRERTSSSPPERERTATRERPSSPSADATPPPAPAPAEQPAEKTPATTKSRAALIAQNDAAYDATRGDPAGQIAPLREAVEGLCTDPSDINCAFALFNLAQAYRLAGRPADAIPLLERRLEISDNQVPVVRQELAAAQAAAGVAPSGGSGNGKGKGKGKGKDD